MSGTVESPCVGICQLDARSICTGCGRTLAEIAGWSQASIATRQAVVARAAERRAAMNPASTSTPKQDRP